MSVVNYITKRFLFIYILSWITFPFVIYARHIPTQTKLFADEDWNFVENRGQLKQNNDVKYYGHQGSVYLYCKPGLISFVFAKVEDDQNVSEATGQPTRFPFPNRAEGFDMRKHVPSKIITSRADLILLNSNLSAPIFASNQQKYYENYYTTGDADHGITNVHTYRTITYRNIYPKIDLILHAKPSGVKYEFVVQPGGIASDIQIQWNGLENIPLAESGSISYATTLGWMNETKPVCFQGNRIIKSSFEKKNNRVSFKISRYDKSKPLVIDPALVWGTYYGGNEGANIHSVSTDSKKNIIITGSTTSSNGIATNAAWLTSYTGMADAFIAKFNPVGSILWATYYGGYEDDEGLSDATDSSDNIFIAGATSSISNIATTGAFQTSNYGGCPCGPLYNEGDAFIAKFNNSGILKWATYYGGVNNDEVNSMAIDPYGNIIIAGSTQSPSRIATAGAFQTSLNYYGVSAFLAKFDTYGNIKWATYYGGDYYSEGNGVSVDILGTIYLVGFTSSNQGIATSSAYKTSIANTASDAFIAKFNNTGERQWATYYGGDDYNTQANAISLDGVGNLYMTGYTSDTSGIDTVILHVSFSCQLAFLCKFNTNGDFKWGKYYGGNQTSVSTIANGIAVKGNSISIAGYTSSSDGIATDGAYLDTLQGNPNYYLGYSGFAARFNPYGKLIWGTYCGQGAGPLTAPDTNSIYVAGSFAYNTDLATKGAYETLPPKTSPQFLVKFSFINNDAGIDSILAPKRHFCMDSANVNVRLKNYGLNNLTKSKILWKVNRKIQKPFSWSGNIKTDSSITIVLGKIQFLPGIDTITAWTSAPNGVTDSLPHNDSVASIIDTIYPYPIFYPDKGAFVCSGAPLTIGYPANLGSSYYWTSSPTGFSSTISKPTIYPTQTGIYTLTETNSYGCTSKDSFQVRVNPLPAAKVIKDLTICDGPKVNLGSMPDSNNIYSWTSNPVGFTSTSSDPEVTPQQTTTYILKQTNQFGCKKSDSVTISVNPVPIAFPGHDTAVCEGTMVTLGTSPVAGNIYSWESIPPGFAATISNPPAIPLLSTTYVLTETNSYGCSKTRLVNVSVNPLPAANTGQPKILCKGDSAMIGAVAITGDSYSWTSNPKGFISNRANPFVLPILTTTYFLLETTKQHCTASDSVVITVSNNAIPDPKWTLNYNGNLAYFHADDSSYSALAYEWHFGDGDSADGHSVTHLYPSNKTYNAGLVLTTPAGCKNEEDSAVDIVRSDIAKGTDNFFQLIAFPNPFNNLTIIQYTLTSQSKISITLVDVTGKGITIVDNEQETEGPHQIEINNQTYDLHPGIYFINLLSKDGFTSIKLVKL